MEEVGVYVKQGDKVHFSFKRIKYLASLLIGSMTLGIIMHTLMYYRTFGLGIMVYCDLLYLVVIAILAILYILKVIKLTTFLVIISYLILFSYALVLPFLFKLEDFSFYSYFLEIQFLIMLFGLILTIGVRPYHDLILGALNIVFATICIFIVQEFQVETFLYYVSIVTAKCIICYVIFEQFFKLRRKMKKHNETIIKQNAELLELTNFRKDIIRIIAHDLRNPVNQIASLLDVETYSETEEERNEIMGHMRNSVGTAYNMLENLLNWAMQNDDSLKEFTMINVEDLILSVENQLSDELVHKRIKIVKRIGFNEEIFYSKNVIESVTRNLLLNAVKFSPMDNDIIVYLENRDTNFSLKFFNKIEMTEIENIDRYTTDKIPLQSTNGTNNEIGSGNGLLVCREMLEKNNGKLTLELKDDGVFATVYVTKVL
ncbi:sensor histidine kinase [Maribacter sp. ACAM166]|uniref:sensor histidine kinase n=1 Tax=Maribacter sp. ACAM166 TaxID=2508996 RepID=UPI0010FD6DA0|nr:HAMP domain-containing sensor histidine kinase [Maribacter sp. ACAM166]TLP81031.1 HAMP domain-containing histidine kinase [Maribacter sp. ACAM166]